MKHNTLLFFLLLLSTFTSFGQATDLDSIQKLYKKAFPRYNKDSRIGIQKMHEVRVLLNDLVIEDEDKKEDYKKIHDGSLMVLLTYHYFLKNYDSISHYNEQIQQKISDFNLRRSALDITSKAEIDRRNFSLAFDLLTKAEQLALADGQSETKVFLENSAQLLGFYLSLDLLEFAEETVQAIEAQMDSVKDQDNFFWIGYRLNKSKLFIETLRIKEAFNILDNIDTAKIKIAPALVNFFNKLNCEAYLAENKHQQALLHANKVYAPKSKDKAIDRFNLFAKIYLKAKDKIKIEELLNEYQTLAVDYGSKIIEEKKYYYLSYQMHKILGNTQEALLFLEKFHSLVYQLEKEQAAVQIAAFNHKLKKEKKVQALEASNDQKELEIQQQKVLYLVVIIALIFISSLIFLIFYFMRKKKRLQLLYELEETKKVTEIKTRFLENISHEFRTPITVIVGYLNLIKTAKMSSTKMFSYLDKAVANCNEMISSLNDFLTVLKLEGNTLEDQPTKDSLLQVVHKCVEAFIGVASFKENQLYFKTNIREDVILEFDYNSLKKILNNLISNAIKYTRQGKAIYIQAMLLENQLLLVVKDEGVGIPEKELQQIFSRFYQSKQHSVYGGFGIGLSLTKELTENLGGDIDVTSKEGYGSQFTVQLPINIEKDTFLTTELESDYKLLNDSSDRVPVESELKKLPKALVVDDNVEMIAYLKEILAPYVNCTFAYDGESALRKAKQSVFDIVISDLRIPLLNGVELHNKLKETSTYREVPFVIITATPNTTNGQNTPILGPTYDYILKPFSELELINRIRILLNERIYEEQLLSTDQKSSSYSDSYSDFLKEINNAILSNYHDSDFDIEKLASLVNKSPSQIRQALKETTGITPVKAILEIRLLKAYELIKEHKYHTLKEVIYAVGLTSRDYFGKAFYKRFGMKPSELK